MATMLWHKDKQSINQAGYLVGHRCEAHTAHAYRQTVQVPNRQLVCKPPRLHINTC